MGGSTPIPLVNWRGCMVSKDLVAPLDDLAGSVRPLVKPIPGYGSYRDNAASGGTDNGSGHVDIYAGDGWTDDDRNTFVANGRQRGLMVFYRPKTLWSPVRQKTLTFTWARHFHVIRKDSADLSDGARKQLSEWYAGSNGLAGFSWNGVWRHDPDTGPRTFLRQTWPQYLATVQEDDMQLTDTVPLVQNSDVAYSTKTSTVGGLLASTNYYVLQTRNQLTSLLQAQGAQITALTAAMTALSTSKGVDPAVVEAAIKAAVDDALDNLRIVSEDVGG